MNKAILLKTRPQGKPKLSDFEFVDEEMPQIQSGEMLLKSIFVSVDPYLRGRMSDIKSYIPPFQLGKPMGSGLVAEVIESAIEGFEKGDYVTGILDWKIYQTSQAKGIHKIQAKGTPLSAYLGVLGMTGLTASLGLSKIGKPKKGETVVVSGAAGAVGSIVGQIAKLQGCRVVGIAGTDEKITVLKSKFGFDEAINYKTSRNLKADLAKACPNGIDVYFDNVGGEISDAVLFNINKYARLVICGAIAIYNETAMPQSMSVQSFLIKNSALMQGFIVSDFASEFPKAIHQLAIWLSEGKLTYTETLVDGFEQIPQAFIDLFDGKNKGKMIVKI